MDCYVAYYSVRRVHPCGGWVIPYRYVRSIGDDDVMSENGIVFMFIIGCATVLTLFGMYVVRKG